MTCCYTTSNASDNVADSVESPTKRRHMDNSPPSIHSALETSDATPPEAHDAMQPWDLMRKNEHPPVDLPVSSVTAAQPPPLPVPAPDHARHGPFHGFKKLPNRNTANGLSEETNIYTETRMLQDQTGRLRRLPQCSLPACALSLVLSDRACVQSIWEMRRHCPFCS